MTLVTNRRMYVCLADRMFIHDSGVERFRGNLVLHVSYGIDEVNWTFLSLCKGIEYSLDKTDCRTHTCLHPAANFRLPLKVMTTR